MGVDIRIRPLLVIGNLLDRLGGTPTMAQQRARSAAQSRRGRFLAMGAGPACDEHDHVVPVEGGEIRVRTYRAVDSAPGPQPLHVFIHGGGWCVGTLHERDPRCRQIAHGARCTVASVEYRLAPEHPYPTPVEDCYAALCWLVDHAEELDLDAGRVSVGGESAGANLAAVMTLVARDRGGPALCYQWLDVPAVDLTLSQPSIHSVPDGNLLDLAAIEAFLDCYLPDRSRATEPYASPLHDPDLSGLPPAWITGCEHDKLRDDSVAYAEALRAAGVPVSHRVLSGHIHASFAFTRVLPSAAAYEREAIAALAAALHPDDP